MGAPKDDFQDEALDEMAHRDDGMKFVI